MGYVNYVVVPDWKMMFVISRYMNKDDLKYIQDDIKKIESCLEDLPMDAFEEKYRDVTLQAFAKYMQIAISCNKLFAVADNYLLDYMFMLMLEDRKIKYRIISEFDLDNEGENKDLDKKHKVIER